ncbi:MAG: hypothetical protein AAGH64_08935 [Planctomycetota bacterium]
MRPTNIRIPLVAKAAVIGVATVCIAGCDDGDAPDSFEEAGENIGRDIDEAGEAIEDGIEELGDDIEDATDRD